MSNYKKSLSSKRVTLLGGNGGNLKSDAMNTPTYRTKRHELVNQFDQQFNYPFMNGFALVKAQYRRENGLEDNHCHLDNNRLDNEVDTFLLDLIKFNGTKSLLLNIKNNDLGINVEISESILARQTTWYNN